MVHHLKEVRDFGIVTLFCIFGFSFPGCVPTCWRRGSVPARRISPWFLVWLVGRGSRGGSLWCGILRGCGEVLDRKWEEPSSLFAEWVRWVLGGLGPGGWYRGEGPVGTLPNLYLGWVNTS
jgi:hypothetical protein